MSTEYQNDLVLFRSQTSGQTLYLTYEQIAAIGDYIKHTHRWHWQSQQLQSSHNHRKEMSGWQKNLILLMLLICPYCHPHHHVLRVHYLRQWHLRPHFYHLAPKRRLKMDFAFIRRLTVREI